MKLLKQIKSPSDIKDLNIFELKQLAREIRTYLIDVTSATGGHLSSNLGVVELTLAVHQSFNSPIDKIIWDVGHQAYVHKIITGRMEELKTIRQFGGISGFPKRLESSHDVFDTGHSSTSISASLGLAAARDIKNETHFVVSIIGDGALTGGMAFEAMNNASLIKKNFIVILNDNQMSIDKNVGGMAEYLDKFRTGHIYNEVKSDVETILLKIPKIGKEMVKALRSVKNGVKQLVVPGMFFEELGFTYLGPIDGHNLRLLKVSLEQAKKVHGPVLLHVLTVKGKGYNPAENDPLKYHGVSPFNKVNGDFHKKVTEAIIPQSYSSIVGDTLVELALIKKEVVAITAAMCSGTGLTSFCQQYPERFFDVGIAEQHAVTFAAGLAVCGLKPFFVVYSSFLQRAYDQVLHDVCIQKLPVVFCLDRSGLVGEDGETHQGVFDISYLSHMPNLTIMAPKSGDELKAMLRFSAEFNEGPSVIRYPKGIDQGFGLGSDVEYGKVEWVTQGSGDVKGSSKNQTNVLIISVGSAFERAREVVEQLSSDEIPVDCVNLRFIAPMDEHFLRQCMRDYRHLYVIEDNMLNGGVTSIIARKIDEMAFTQGIEQVIPHVFGFGIDDAFVTHGKIDELNKSLGLDSNSIYKAIKHFEGCDVVD
jgi:1-deoxy-D-xylulose-5-phosphate synthase